MEKQVTSCYKIFANYTCNKELVFKYIKNSHNLTGKKANNPIRKWTKDMNSLFHWREYINGKEASTLIKE